MICCPQRCNEWVLIPLMLSVLKLFFPIGHICFSDFQKWSAAGLLNRYVQRGRSANQKDIHFLFHPANISNCHLLSLFLACAGKFSSIMFCLFLSFCP